MAETAVPRTPPPSPNSKGVSIYPFPTMDVGDSVLFPAGKPGSVERDIAMRARQSAYQYGRRTGKKFAARVASDGMRIWRTE